MGHPGSEMLGDLSKVTQVAQTWISDDGLCLIHSHAFP